MSDLVNNRAELKDIKIGDVLHSEENDCKVTVEAITTDGQIVCVWMDGDYHAHRELIFPDNLSCV